METNSNFNSLQDALSPWVLTSSGETQMVSSSGWYTSYWNAFMLVYKSVACQAKLWKSNVFCHVCLPSGRSPCDHYLEFFSWGPPSLAPNPPSPTWGISPYRDSLISWTCSNLITWTWTDPLLIDLEGGRLPLD